MHIAWKLSHTQFGHSCCIEPSSTHGEHCILSEKGLKLIQSAHCMFLVQILIFNQPNQCFSSFVLSYTKPNQLQLPDTDTTECRHESGLNIQIQLLTSKSENVNPDLKSSYMPTVFSHNKMSNSIWLFTRIRQSEPNKTVLCIYSGAWPLNRYLSGDTHNLASTPRQQHWPWRSVSAGGGGAVCIRASCHPT